MASSRNQPAIAGVDHQDETGWMHDNFEATHQPNKSEVPALHGDYTFSRKLSTNNLWIDTASEPDPHERYISSEEEPSPSPDSDSASQYKGDESASEERSDHKLDQLTDKENDEPTEMWVEDCQAEIAIAIPIMSIGRPKLIDISNIAPMHKRKRPGHDKTTLARTAMKNAASRPSERKIEDNQSKLSGKESDIGPEGQASNSGESGNRQESIPQLLQGEVDTVAVEDREYYTNTDLRNPPSYVDYDPYALHPPKLSPRNSYSGPNKTPGSVARARRQASRPSLRRGPNSRGMGNQAIFSKRQEEASPTGQLRKKPKMLPRGASERSQMAQIPPFAAELTT